MTLINDPAIVAEVTAAAEAYEVALIKNQVDDLQAFFWDSAEAIRFGVNEQLYGIAEINDFRRNRVINFSDRKPLRLTVTTFDRDTASVMYEYTCTVMQLKRQGRQSQFWRRIEGVWKIVSAHVSLVPLALNDEAAWADYLRRAADAQKLPIDPAYAPGVARNLQTIAELVQPLLDLPLPESVEPAPVFKP
ncbi:MAG: hypothetical protein SynsKO_01810 [Synoicihabitans sp.]